VTGAYLPGYITDLGHEVLAVDQTGDCITIPRFAVWGLGEPDVVIATGSDLAALQAEHGPELPVYSIVPVTR
jgi:hypothetical protein